VSDVKFALRLMLRSPGYTAAAALTLALAIGVTTAIFSVVDGVLLRPLPYADPDRLVTIWESAVSFPEMSVNYPDFLDWQKAQRTMTEIAAYRGDSFNLTGLDKPERLEGAMYSATLLPLLGVSPPLGRNFTADEDQLQGPPACLVSHRFWKHRLGGERKVLGQSLTLDGTPHTIVGVLPDGFRLDKADVVVPLGRLPEGARRRGNHPGIQGVGRLKPGVTLQQARVDFETIGAALGKLYQPNQGVLPALAPLHARLVKDVRAKLWRLLAGVGLVLLIAIANVANLTLARATVRRREMAIRAALGAGRARLVRQLLVESTMVAVLGGALGVVLALWGVDVLQALRPEDALPQQAVIHVDHRVLLFTVAVSLASGILFGIVPALGISRPTANPAVHTEARSAMVVVEVAIALVVLVMAGLVTRTFVRLAGSELGFRPDHVLTATMPVPLGKFKDKTSGLAFLRQVSERLRAMPGVAEAAITIGLPLAGAAESGFAIEGRPPPRDVGDAIMAVYYATDERYLEAMRIPLLAGRYFRSGEGADAPKVAVIDEVMARELFPAGALGKHFVDEKGKPDTEIVGVVKHVVNYGVGEKEPARFQVYIPLAQASDHYFTLMIQTTGLVVRTSGMRPERQSAAMAAAVTALDPQQPIYGVKPMQALVDESLGPRRFVMLLFGAFGALALVLAWIGLYAVMSYSVAQRTKEIGVRMALGARAGHVRGMVLAQGMSLVGIGVAGGAVLAVAATRYMSAILVGVDVIDPLTVLGMALVLASAAMVATFLPARRATRVDPMVAIRSE
jgi:putative ABC transport system permease protein